MERHSVEAFSLIICTYETSFRDSSLRDTVLCKFLTVDSRIGLFYSFEALKVDLSLRLSV